jgi:hypothetical protein
MSSHSPSLPMIGRPPVPPVLLPLAPAPIIPPPLRPRARSTVPETAIRKAAARAWTRQWTGLRVPLILPGVGPKTGWENTAVIANLRILAGVSIHTTDTGEINLASIPGHMRKIYPIKLKPKPITQYQPPPPRATRQNPATWSNPHRLTRRLLRRAYQRLWENLVWVRPRGDGSDQWEVCTFAELEERPLKLGTGKKSRKEKKQGSSNSVTAVGEEANMHWL